MPDSLYSLIYISTAEIPFTSEQLEDLLVAARDFNAVHDITGMLLFRDGCFMQLLEGPRQTVVTLYDRIREDRRHSGVVTLLEGPARQREFPDWSMGFRNLRSPAVRALPGFTDFLETPLTTAQFTANPSQARSLLLSFKRDE